MSDDDSYRSNRHEEPRKTPEEIERTYCEELSRKMIEWELDPKNFWKMPKAK